MDQGTANSLVQTYLTDTNNPSGDGYGDIARTGFVGEFAAAIADYHHPACRRQSPGTIQLFTTATLQQARRRQLSGYR